MNNYTLIIYIVHGIVENQYLEVKIFRIFLLKILSIDTCIPFAAQRGMQLLKASSILYMKTESNYTTLFFADGSNTLLTKTSKSLSAYLPVRQFVRIRQSYLVNKDYVTTIKKSDITLNYSISLTIRRR